MTALTIGYTEAGKSKLLAGPEVHPNEQRDALAKYREEGLPKGIVRAEMWTKAAGCIKKAVAGEKPEGGADSGTTPAPDSPDTQPDLVD